MESLVFGPHDLQTTLVAGGAASVTGSDAGVADLDSVEIYNVETDTWRTGEATLCSLM